MIDLQKIGGASAQALGSFELLELGDGNGH